jgi:3'-5' exoribonuclease
MDPWLELQERLTRVENPHVAALLRDVVGSRETRLRAWPAAVTVHHAYEGGLLEHILSVARAGDALARLYGADADLVLAGAVLHDIGKLDELTFQDGAIGYSRAGNLLGHIAIGVVLVREAAARVPGLPDDLRTSIEHLVVSHHGARPLGSPVEPMTVEAFILSAVDDLDAKIHQVRRHVADDQSEGDFTAFHPRLRRVLLKPSDR